MGEQPTTTPMIPPLPAPVSTPEPPQHSSISSRPNTSSSASSVSLPTATPVQLPTNTIEIPKSPILSSSPSGNGSTPSNRFGLALNFIQRRPRGFTNPSGSGRAPSSPTGSLTGGGRGGGSTSPIMSSAAGTSGNGGDALPSPSSLGAGGGSYGFPSLRRTLSRKPSASPGNESNGGSSVDNNNNNSPNPNAGASIISRVRGRRSSSQPPHLVRTNGKNEKGVEGVLSNTSAGGSSKGSGFRPRTADATTGASQPSTSANATFSNSSLPSQTPSVSLGFTCPLPSSSTSSLPPSLPVPATSGPGTATPTYRIRLVPHLESSRSLPFDPVDRDLEPFTILKVGRFTEKGGGGVIGAGLVGVIPTPSSHLNPAAITVTDSTSTPNATPKVETKVAGGGEPKRIAFKSKVVSRAHCSISCDTSGTFFLRDTSSSSGTFLNHIRLSGPGLESRGFEMKDGDVLQLGVDYQGGTEEIYRCVKMRVELKREWQRGVNTFNTNALAQLRALGGGSAPSSDLAKVSAAATSMSAAKMAAASSVTDCCICLYPVTVCQALFIAPCSHVTHFKCIRPLITTNYPGFSCPLCRTYANLEADVEVELEAWETDLLGAEETHTPADMLAPKLEDRPDEVLVISESTVGTSSKHLPTPSRPISIIASSSSSSPPSHLRSAEEDLYASLASATTPPNSTFLSTLADHHNQRPHFYPIDTMPVSLDQALCNTFVGKGTMDSFLPPGIGSPNGEEGLYRLPQETQRSDERRQQSSSSEDETDGNTNEVDEEGVESEVGSSSRVGGKEKVKEGGVGEKEEVGVKGKGKEKAEWIASPARNDSEIPLEDLLDCTA